MDIEFVGGYLSSHVVIPNINMTLTMFFVSAIAAELLPLRVAGSS